MHRYKEGKCSDDELRQLQRYLTDDAYTSLFERALGTSLLEQSDDFVFKEIKENKLEDLYRSIISKTMEKEVRRNSMAPWMYAAAALVLMAAAISLYRYIIQSVRMEATVELTTEPNVAPGGNRATLTLADGRVIKLNEQQQGIVMRDQIQYEDGTVLLDSDGLTGAGNDNSFDTIQYTLATPRGGTYQLTLPDGTKVWLNAESSLTYPARFAEGERVVSLAGEGYFVVAQDARSAFKVISDGQEIEVLGTAFNLSAYPDARTNTTLVQGRVKVVSVNRNTSKKLQVMLSPGQRAENLGAEITVRQVNIAAHVGWKNGVFYFDETRLMDAMDQLSRWYDLEVSYQGPIPDTHFYGEISRDKTLKEVLAILQEGGVRFRIETEGGRNRLLVLPL